MRLDNEISLGNDGSQVGKRKVRSPAAILTDKLDLFLEHSAQNNCM